MTDYGDVYAFHRLWHEPNRWPKLPDGTEWSHRVRLITEEFAELSKAHAVGDLVAFADGIVDMAWVVLGTGVVTGLPYDALWYEVKRANMAKAGSKLDASGKFTKPPGWVPPDIGRVLFEHHHGGPCSHYVGLSGVVHRAR